MSTDIAVIVGSLRRESVSRSVFMAASQLVGDDASLREVDITQVPFFNEDLEVDGGPASVAALKAAVDSADGLIFFTPEYNGSFPALTKNAIDWLSRSQGASVLNGKPIGVVSATPGAHEAASVRSHFAASVGMLSDRLFDRSIGIASATRVIADGVITDEATAENLGTWLRDFIAFVQG
ncbi:MAG: NAD(P)H-dependent oxidoreductase [Actinobacteria bacterium]|nr:NAD(P)H-dependent oxidoreductase [Actinomycetota bacterium]